MRKMKRLTAFLLVLCAVLCQLQPVAYAVDYFLVNYPDPHFDLRNEPNRVATIEEFVTYTTTKPYWQKGVSTTPATDKNGKSPSEWCAKYVQQQVEMQHFFPQKISYSDPATVYFAAEFLSRCRGQYHWNYEYEYSFSNTSGLTAEQQMFLNVAAECNLIPYTPRMDAKRQITRGEMDNWLASTKPATHPAAPALSSDGSMKELNVYYILEADPQEQLKLLKQYSNVITLVSFYLTWISDHGPLEGNQFIGGRLGSKEPWLADDNESYKEAIEYCNQNGITPLLSIGNYGKSGYDSATIENMLSTDANQNTCIQEIIRTIQENNLKGVNLGFEFVNPQCRNSYINFITKLNTELDKHGWLLMNTIGAYFASDTTDPENDSFYDYPAIANVSDYVHIILYDDFSDSAYMTGKVPGPGPMSGLEHIDRVLKYATHRMPAGKILIGLSSFAVDYFVNEKKASDVARNVVLQHATSGITATTDNSYGGYFNYTDSDGKPHIVYLESDDGIQKRLYRMFRYNLCGASLFYLGADFPALYKNAAEMSPNRLEVMSAAKEGIIPIYKRNFYKNAITRVEFCDLIVSMIEAKTKDTIDNFMAEKKVSIKQGQFSDTNSRNVLCAAALGIVNGRENGTFTPYNAITRQEAAAMLSRLADCMGYSGTVAKMEFNDTKSLASWAQEGIAKVSGITDPTNNKRVMNGTSSGNFSPYGTYTREQGYMTIIRLFHAL